MPVAHPAIGHVFCLPCIDYWARRGLAASVHLSMDCPLCRQSHLYPQETLRLRFEGQPVANDLSHAALSEQSQMEIESIVALASNPSLTLTDAIKLLQLALTTSQRLSSFPDLQVRVFLLFIVYAKLILILAAHRSSTAAFGQ